MLCLLGQSNTLEHGFLTWLVFGYSSRFTLSKFLLSLCPSQDVPAHSWRYQQLQQASLVALLQTHPTRPPKLRRDRQEQASRIISPPIFHVAAIPGKWQRYSIVRSHFLRKTPLIILELPKFQHKLAR